MSDDLIKQLLEALALSPENVPLRMQVGELLQKTGRYPEAVQQYQEILSHHYGHPGATQKLAACYYHMGKYAAALIIYEEQQDQLGPAEQILFIKCLLKEGSRDQALQRYQQWVALHPGASDPELDSEFRVSVTSATDEDEDLLDEGYFLEKPSLRFSDVGGMQRVKEEINLKIIAPMKNPELFKAYGKKIGGGILLYGPPGCGKTYIAKATAGEINARFINIGLHDILDMWMGNSEKNLHEIFELARRNTPCVLFFDEVDAMGASRNDLRQSSMRHVINQFLAELDGVASDNEGVLIIGATNAPWSLDGAFRRPGRFDRILFVEPPDAAAREEILMTQLQGKPLGEIAASKVAGQLEGYSGADIKAVVDIAVEGKITQAMKSGTIESLTTKDLLQAAKQHRATTEEWFSAARNYALYANEAGLYDEILRYLKIKK